MCSVLYCIIIIIIIIIINCIMYNYFIQEKRSSFPRFYFIGDEDLLEILGQATQPEVIQSHLKKLFAGIHSVVFSRDSSHLDSASSSHPQIVAMKSLEGETVPLSSPVTVTTEVEVRK